LSDDDVFAPPVLGDEHVFAPPDPAQAHMATPDGELLAGRFALREADDIRASHDVHLRENEDHAAEVGTDPRSRGDMEQRVQQIVHGFTPALLGDSPHVDEGAPVVGPDGLVEAGNARAIALQRVQQVRGQKAADYRDWLRENAHSFGIDPAEVDGARKPMLVRVRDTATDRAAVGQPIAQANLKPTLQAAAGEIGDALREHGEIQVDDGDKLHPETVEVLQFLAHHAEQPEIINALLETNHGKPSEDTGRRHVGEDAAPDHDARGESAPAQSDRGGDQGHGPAGSGAGGQAVGEGWEAFAPHTGTRGVPRAEMPQIKSEHRGALTQFLLARGIPHDQEEVAPENLRPTQAEWSPPKVANAVNHDGGDRAVLVSADGHVLDGHHQWLAALAQEKPIRVIRFDAPIERLLTEAREFPSAEVAR